MSTTVYGIFWEDYVYVGQTSGSVQDRFKRHLTELAMRRHTCPLLQQIYNFYGEELQVKTLETNASKSAEGDWIRSYGDRSLNVSKGVRSRTVIREKGRPFVIKDDFGKVIWEGMGERQAARDLGITRSTVQWRRKRDN